MRILYLTQWFEPEPAFKGEQFADMLAAKGHEVEVATGFPNYPGGKLYAGHRLRPYWRMTTASGRAVHRLWLYPSHDGSTVGRALNYGSFFLSCLLFLLARGRRYDAVYVYHPPLTPALAAILARWFHRYRVIVDVQDLWPDSVLASGMLPKWLGQSLGALCRFVYRAADGIVAQTEGMRDRILAHGAEPERVTRIYNWATYQEGGQKSAAPAERPAGHPSLIYGGNIGQAQSLLHVVRAAELAARSLPDLRFHVFGSGIERDALERHLQANPETPLVLHAPVDRSTMDRIFDQADILILHLKGDPLYEFTMPSKAQHYLACGKPIVAGIAGEAAALLACSGAAIVTAPEDTEAMADAIAEWARLSPEERLAAGRRGKDFYRETFGAAQAMEQTLRAVNAAATSARRDRNPATMQVR